MLFQLNAAWLLPVFPLLFCQKLCPEANCCRKTSHRLFNSGLNCPSHWNRNTEENKQVLSFLNLPAGHMGEFIHTCTCSPMAAQTTCYLFQPAKERTISANGLVLSLVQSHITYISPLNSPLANMEQEA